MCICVYVWNAIGMRGWSHFFFFFFFYLMLAISDTRHVILENLLERWLTVILTCCSRFKNENFRTVKLFWKVLFFSHTWPTCKLVENRLSHSDGWQGPDMYFCRSGAFFLRNMNRSWEMRAWMTVRPGGEFRAIVSRVKCHRNEFSFKGTHRVPQHRL